jgi:hypothetical protein
VGKGVPGFRIERAPSRAGVSALDHQATPAASYEAWYLARSAATSCVMLWSFHGSFTNLNSSSAASNMHLQDTS